MRHGQEQITDLNWREARDQTALFQPVRDDLVSPPHQELTAFVHTLFGGDEAWDWSLKAELIEFRIVLSKGHVVFQARSGIVPQGGGGLREMLYTLGEEAHPQAKERVIDAGFPGKIFVEGRGPDPYPPGDLLQVEGGDPLFTHHRSGGVE